MLILLVRLASMIAVYYNMTVNYLKWNITFTDTNFFVLLFWWLLAPLSQVSFFLLSLNGLSMIEIGFVAILGCIEAFILVGSSILSSIQK